MTHDLSSVLLDHRVERVDRFRIDMVHPRGERAVGAQLATMLVRDDVVRIVGADAVEPEPPTGRPSSALLATTRYVPSASRCALPEQPPDIRLLEAAPVVRSAV